MSHTQPSEKSRTPKNTVGGRPLPLRLSVEERESIDAMAQAECRSASNMARIVFLIGLAAMKNKKTDEKED